MPPRSRSPHSLTTLTCLALLCTVAPAAAEEPDLTDAGQAVLMEAAAAAQKKDWAVCRTKAAGVWDKVKHPTVAALLGACEAELGMFREAATHLDFFLQRDDGKNPKQSQAAKDRFPGVRAKVMLAIVETSAAAEIRVDGAVVGPAPQRVFLDPGEHTLAATAGSLAGTKTLTAIAGGEEKVLLILKDSGAGGAGGGGGAPSTSASSGSSTSTTGAGGGEPEEGKPIWPAVLLGGVGAAGLATGIALLVVGTNDATDAIDTAKACQPWTDSCRTEGNDALSSANALRGGGIAAVAIGGASLLGMVIYLAVPAGPSADEAAFRPLVGPGFAGLSFEGSF